MTKSQHKRTAAASMFQNGISQNTKCAVRDGFRRDSHKSFSIYESSTAEAVFTGFLKVLMFNY